MAKKLVMVLLGAALFCGGMAVGQRPIENISPRNHPDLAAAQRLSAQAFDRIVAAQQAHGYQLGGHAQKARELLLQVNQELRLAADWANGNRR